MQWDVPWTRLVIYLMLSTLVLGNLATWMRARYQWPDGYSRKLNHFGHMVIATPLLAFLPPHQLLPAVAIGGLAVIAIYAYSAMSAQPGVYGIVSGSLRRRDAPRARFFFFFPLVTGNLALVASALIFPIDALRIAFFTAAFADGFAEPIGLRFGRNNQYTIRDAVWSGRNTKSFAGSAAVAAWSFVIAAVALGLQHGLEVRVLLLAITYAVAVTVLEAAAPRGMDNMLIIGLAPGLIVALSAAAW